MPARGKKRGRRIAPPVISARLSGHIELESQADGSVAASFDGYSVGLGKFSSAVLSRLQELRTGLPLASFAGSRLVDKEIDLLIRRLARSGLLEYRFAPPGGGQPAIPGGAGVVRGRRAWAHRPCRTTSGSGAT